MELCYTRGCSSYAHGTRYISLDAISSDKQHGFLPTFGPTFLYFYATDGQGDGYAGKILMSIETEIEMDIAGVNPKSVKKAEADPIDEVDFPDFFLSFLS